METSFGEGDVEERTFLTRGMSQWSWRSSTFLVFNLIDCALTCILRDMGMYEASPVWDLLPVHTVWFKMMPAFLFAYLLRRRQTVMLVLAIGMGLVVVWNLAVLIMWRWG